MFVCVCSAISLRRPTCRSFDLVHVLLLVLSYLSLSLTYSHSLIEPYWSSCPSRDYLSPIDLIGNYPHLVVLGTGLAFGFLVVSGFEFVFIVT